LRRAAFAACLPNASRVFLGSREIVRFLLAALAAFLIFFLAARLCLADAIKPPRQFLTTLLYL
jgi:hypothetical protein